MARVEVKYVTLKGWQTSITKVRKFSDLPKNAQDYVRTIEKLVEVPGIQSIVCFKSLSLYCNNFCFCFFQLNGLVSDPRERILFACFDFGADLTL